MVRIEIRATCEEEGRRERRVHVPKLVSAGNFMFSFKKIIVFTVWEICGNCWSERVERDRACF